jgi:hypothetical protein
MDTGEHLSTLYSIGFYISSTPSNITHAIINIESHYSLQVFHLLHFSFSPLIPTYNSTLPAADPFISSFNVLIFTHQHVPISTMWCPAPLKAIPAPQCYLQHIPIHPMKHKIVQAAPSFLTTHASNHNPLPQSLYSFLIQSLDLPAPAPFSSSPQSTPCHLLFEANPTYYLSLIPALYSNFICLTPFPQNPTSPLSPTGFSPSSPSSSLILTSAPYVLTSKHSSLTLAFPHCHPRPALQHPPLPLLHQEESSASLLVKPQ